MERGPNHVLRYLFYLLVVRPIALIVLGLNVRHRERLPCKGPAIIVANHNSHLDAMVLMTLFPLRMLHHVFPVAAADYFLKNKYIGWFALRLVGILPLQRKGFSHKSDPLEGCVKALGRGDILIIFPEGQRGEPEQLGQFKSGIAHIAERFPEVPFIPIFMHGLGKALPKGEALLVPFFIDIFVGETFVWTGERKTFMGEFETRLAALSEEGRFNAWE